MSFSLGNTKSTNAKKPGMANRHIKKDDTNKENFDLSKVELKNTSIWDKPTNNVPA